ncbi:MULTISPECIES: hypothetical protein [Haloferax]|uniref:DUF8215 domain-containing protein n=1 Tax=Haloferax marinum TaxID=2666143 RepID=A0A6A8G1S1_9EURY|nr:MULTISPECIES: hypothetical protein [Haloferax]KAB1196014.1 hypothetical protein Hfx1150_00175 [Haloferax sp. CBA1150]MRW94991.1 hypothetical protein [Haloferax marinum]
MASGTFTKTVKRVDRWLDQVFFAAWEVSVLAIPTLWLLLAATPPEAVSLSGTAALVASAAAVGTYRGEYVSTGTWPRPGHLPTLPVRSAYYSLVVGGTALVGAAMQAEFGWFWAGIILPVIGVTGALALVPVVIDAVERTARVTI